MVYSLLNASAIGFDVVRRPAAARLTGVLLTALTASPVLLGELAASHPAAGLPRQEQREALAATALIRSGRAASAAADPIGDAATGGPTSWAVVAQRLARFSLGGPAELDRLLAVELLGPSARTVPDHVHRLAADTLAEAALDAWTAATTDPPSATQTRLERAVASCSVPPGIDVGPCADQLDELLATLPGTVQQWESWRADRRPRPRPVEWARAMHEATWAAYLSGRTRAAAAAQLLTVVQLADTGVHPAGAAGWVWNRVSASVAATVVADLLPEDTTSTLTQTFTCGTVLPR